MPYVGNGKKVRFRNSASVLAAWFKGIEDSGRESGT